MTPKDCDARRAAVDVVSRLQSAGHQAVWAGGCVRDPLLNLAPKDYDVATNATPARIRELYPKSREVGAQFGVMLVRRWGWDIEVATFRADGAYSDGRHPDEVRFGTMEEDARRRDFTINGVFYDPITDRVIDLVGGCADLRAGVIRTIGDPQQRFQEDHLRLIRAVRFSARLGFSIEESTRKAMRELAAELGTVSPERIWQELERILIHPSRAAAWSIFVEAGLLPFLCGAFQTGNDENERIGRRLAGLPNKDIRASLGLAALLFSLLPDAAERICKALRLSNRLTQAVVYLVRSASVVLAATDLELADLKSLMANENWGDLLSLVEADLRTGGQSTAELERIQRRAACIQPGDVSPQAFLSGEDLKGLGLVPGPQFGEVVDLLYRAQLNEIIRSREEALDQAAEIIRRLPEPPPRLRSGHARPRSE
ncbi:MAG: CCA tRNA nucleotidyltransferase [Planctomycetota bacterium]